MEQKPEESYGSPSMFYNAAWRVPSFSVSFEIMSRISQSMIENGDTDFDQFAARALDNEAKKILARAARREAGRLNLGYDPSTSVGFKPPATDAQSAFDAGHDRLVDDLNDPEIATEDIAMSMLVACGNVDPDEYGFDQMRTELSELLKKYERATGRKIGAPQESAPWFNQDNDGQLGCIADMVNNPPLVREPPVGEVLPCPLPAPEAGARMPSLHGLGVGQWCTLKEACRFLVLTTRGLEAHVKNGAILAYRNTHREKSALMFKTKDMFTFGVQYKYLRKIGEVYCCAVTGDPVFLRRIPRTHGAK